MVKRRIRRCKICGMDVGDKPGRHMSVYHPNDGDFEEADEG
jgi:hypothetical protein